MRNSAYSPFRASKFLIDTNVVIDNNRNFLGTGATFTNDVIVGTGITFYASTGIVSATKLYGDGS